MAIGTAIRYLRKGEWQKAHAIVQSDESVEACWAHGIVHMLEGDVGNARYWYRRAHRAFPRDYDVGGEIDALVASVKSAQGDAASRVAGRA
jgi:hypothetical protein